MRAVLSISCFLSDIFRRKRPVHLFVDGDQISPRLTERAISALANAGYRPKRPITVFCNKHGVWRWKETLSEYNFIEVPEGKNIADTHIILECGKLLAGTKAKTIAILSGDSIFSATATAIKSSGGIPILLIPSSRANLKVFSDSHALCLTFDDKKEETVSDTFKKPSTDTNSQPKKIKKNSSVRHRRNRAINQLKKELLPLSLEYLEDVASVACVEREGEPTLQQMLQDHPDIRLFEKAGVYYAIHVQHDVAIGGNVVSISG